MNDKIDKLKRLRKERNAVILAHYYQQPEIQDVADFLGDSLALSQKAMQTNADVILFCGVKFMAETAKILNPEKTVLLPDMNAGCSLADSATPEKFTEWVAQHPDHVVISYINSSTPVKAMSDIICTSSNAVKIVESVPKDKKILFAPDKYLGAHVIKQTGSEMTLWDGTCEVHEVFSEIQVIKLMKEHPSALFLAHPECPQNILQYANLVGSTSKIIKYAAESDAKEFIIGTEPGIIHELRKRAPGKTFYPVPNINGCNCNECPHMKLNTIDKMIAALETLTPEITIPEELRLKALVPLERMLELS